MSKIRWSWDRLIFNTGIPILARRHLYIERAPGSQCHHFVTSILYILYLILNSRVPKHNNLFSAVQELKVGNNLSICTCVYVYVYIYVLFFCMEETWEHVPMYWQLVPICFEGWVMAKWLACWTQQWVAKGVSETLEPRFEAGIQLIKQFAHNRIWWLYRSTLVEWYKQLVLPIDH